MKTKTLIQSSANILRITDLQKGNTVKIVTKEYSSNEIMYGVVTDLLNSGEKTYIQFLLFKDSYGDIGGNVKVYSGDEDIAIFPTTVEEVQEHLSDAVKRMGEKLEKEKYELNNKIQAFETAKDFVSGQTSAKLTETSYEEITTAEFNKEQKQKKIEEINSTS